MTRRLFILLLVATASVSSGRGVRLRTTVDASFVALGWPGIDDADGFNLYRRVGRGEYEKLNDSLIRPWTDSVAIRSLIPPRSREAEAVRSMLGVEPEELYRGHGRYGRGPDFERKEQRQLWLKARDLLALRFLKLGLIAGLAWVDSPPAGSYEYAIEVVENREPRMLERDVQAKAGKPVLLQGPAGVSAQAGDRMVFVTWDVLDGAVAYQLSRSNSQAGQLSLLSPQSGAVGMLTVNPITFESLPVPKPGFLDTTCLNNKTYYYRVEGVDILDRTGKPSPVVGATPRDMAPPETPAGVSVEPLIYGLRVIWPKVTEDVAGRDEKVLKYHVWRYPSYRAADQDSAGKKAGEALLVPDTLLTAKIEEHYPKLAPDSVYWYRVSCEDDALPVHNLSAKSAPVSGFFKDTVPPGAPTKLVLDPYEDSMILSWIRPPDKDLAGFDVYRGICGGESVSLHRDLKKYEPYRLSMIANIDSGNATSYVDRSLPKGSPICYRYALKAYDTNQNPSPMSESICSRLRDRTGPLAPVISGLKARDRAVLVEWVAPPVQDLHGFVVERTSDTSGSWQRVSPKLKLPDPKTLNCESIPPVSRWKDTVWSFLDTSGVRAETAYWYRVRGVDYLGNEGENSAEIGTFTYSREILPLPVILSVTDNGAGVVSLTWQPGYDTTYLGFAVFRSQKSDSGYRQISRLIRANSYADRAVARKETYHYRVQYIGKDGNRSLPSAPVSYTLP